MKKQISTYVLCALLGLSTTACTTQTRVISRAESQELVTATLSDSDFESAAKEMLDDMLANDFFRCIPHQNCCESNRPIA